MIYKTFEPTVAEVACANDAQGRCLTCSDALETVRIIELVGDTGLAVVEGEQGQVEIDITLLGTVEPGSLILVHGGVALALADEG